jgi:cytochrome c oxidase cbb3-type subunit 1
MSVIWGLLVALGASLGLLLWAQADDIGMRIHGCIIFLAAVLAGFLLIKRHFDRLARPEAVSAEGYDEAVVRYAVIAAMFWGVAGFLAGLALALQLAFPVLNFDLPWINFGRLRPLHTSAVIFAFGGNV